MKVDILGTEYSIITDGDTNNKKLEGCSGYVEFYSKDIIIKKHDQDETTVNKFEEFEDLVLRHEMVHAFLFESGLGGTYSDEVLVDWIASQIPKMIKSMKAAGCLKFE